MINSVDNGTSLLSQIKSEPQESPLRSSTPSTSRGGSGMAVGNDSLSTASPPRPVLRQFKSTAAPVEQFYDIGLGDARLIQSIQLNDLLKVAQSNPGSEQVAPPQLVANEAAGEMMSPMPNFSNESVQELLRRAIILVCVYNGYEVTTDSVLQVLVDVGGAFMKKICAILRHAVDTKEFRTEEDLSIEMYRIFEDIGFSMPSLQNYVSDITVRRNNLVKEVSNKVGPLVVPCPAPRTICAESLTEPLDLLVGLEDEKATELNQAAKFPSWEKSLDELGILNSTDILDDYESLGS